LIVKQQVERRKKFDKVMQSQINLLKVLLQPHSKLLSEYEIVEFAVNEDDFNLNIASVTNPEIVLGEDNMKSLAAYESVCFPEEIAIPAAGAIPLLVQLLAQQPTHGSAAHNAGNKYYLSLIEFLTNEYILLEDSSDSEDSEDSMSCDEKQVFTGLYRERFEINKECADSKKVEVEWKFFIYMAKNADKIAEIAEIAASCLVKHNKNKNSYEIHSVCVGESGKRHCSAFIPGVFKYLQSNDKSFSEIRIYCEQSNKGACACYAKIPGTTITTEENKTHYILLNDNV